MIHKLGMPYMGNKRKLAKPIIDFILNENPNAKYFYDLFGGGGSISFEAFQRPQIKGVFYNELNTGVVALLRDVIENGVTDKYYQWIDRDTFNKHKNDDDWFSGLCKTIWSFGNNQKDYLFGKKIEENKRLLHEIVVNKCEKLLIEFNHKIKTDIKLENNQLTLCDETINQRRLRIIRVVKGLAGRVDAEELQRLQRLQQLEQLERLNISNYSYDKVNIDTPINETIIYLDPPYKNTAKYCLDICHEKLLNYINNSKYKIYVSSYEMDLDCVLTLNHRSTLSASANNKTIEKLFTNSVTACQ